jgi:hypothetical protein
MTDNKTKNTLLTPKSTMPQTSRIPPKNPFFQQKRFPSNIPKFTQAFRTQSRGGK